MVAVNDSGGYSDGDCFDTAFCRVEMDYEELKAENTKLLNLLARIYGCLNEVEIFLEEILRGVIEKKQ